MSNCGHTFSLKIACWNIQGLVQDKHKEQDLVDYVNKFDCTILLETWLNNSVSFANMYTYCKPAIKSKHGRSMAGFVIIINHLIKQGVSIIESSNSHFIWLKFKKEFFKCDKDIFVCAVYMPPVNSVNMRNASCEPDLWDQLEDSLLKYIDQGNIMIIGDLNSRIGKSSEIVEYNNVVDELTEEHDLGDIGNRNSHDTVINKFGRKLLEICRHTNLCILNGRILGDLQGSYTSFHYNGSAVVDYCITDRELYDSILYFKIHDPSHLSDHTPISVYINIDNIIVESKPKYAVFPSAFKWNEESFVKALETKNIKCRISQIEKKIYGNDSNAIDKICDELSTVIVNTAKCSLKRRKNGSKQKQNQAKWYNKSLILQKNEVLHTGKLLRKYPTDPHIRGNFILKKKYYKRACRSVKRNYMKTVAAKIEQAEISNKSEFWRILKGISKETYQDQESEFPSMEDFIKVFDKNNDHSNLNKGYDTTFKGELENKFKSSQIDREVESLDKPINQAELYKAVNKLQKGKACGLDLISNEMIKCSLPLVKTVMLKLFNACLDSGYYPASWCKGYIIPIHKSGSKLEPSNFRPVTISSCLGKVFSSILNTRISDFIENNNLISNLQIGFLKGHRTADHLLLLKGIVDSYKRKGKHVYSCFLDFASAFDNVWHKGLIYKLYNIGFSGKIVTLLQSMYSQIHSCIKRGDRISNLFKSDQGTRQGCNLSPTLFKVYINDIYRIFNKPECDPVTIGNDTVGCLMFADDILILSRSARGLQISLNNLNKYCMKWRLPINEKKTKTMVFNSRKHNQIFKIGSQVLQDTTRVCYLGFILNPSGKFSSTQKYLYDKASRALFKLRKTTNKIPDLSVRAQIKLFDSVIKPVLLYGSEVWGAYMYNQKGVTLASIMKDVTSYAEKLHSKVCKYVLQINKNASNYAVRCELGRYPLIIDIICKILKYYVNIRSRSEKSIVKVALSLHNSFSGSWLDFIKFITNSLHINLQNLNKNNISFGKNSVRNKLVVLSSQTYIAKLQEYSKLKLLSSLKINFGKESYLSNIYNIKLRKVVTQLRLSCHRLPVEIGRYQGVEHDNRLCKLCDMCWNACTLSLLK